jgi:hypothetical protein
VRCDRQNPCTTCSRRGLARSCVYSIDGQENILPRSAGTVHERIHHLQSLVISLMQQNQTTTGRATSGSISVSDPPNGSAPKQVTSPNHHIGPHGSGSQPEPISSATSSISIASAVDSEANADIPSAPLDGGCLRYDSLGTANNVSSSHWAAVLNSITELKEHFEQEVEFRSITTDLNFPNPVHSNWPQLLYSCQRITEVELLSSIPPRRVVDR